MLSISVQLFSLITLVRGNIFKNILSDRVHTYLRDQYKDNPTKCECMIEYFRFINIWEKFYSEDILGEQRKLVRDLRPYIEDADSSKKYRPKCYGKKIEFFFKFVFRVYSAWFLWQSMGHFCDNFSGDFWTSYCTFYLST